MDVDVVVVGAGPVGLLAAIELTLGGARVLVLERLASPNKGIKALAVGPLGSEALQRRGMAEPIRREEQRNLATINQFRLQAGETLKTAKFSGHFAFLSIRKDAQKEPDRRMHAVDQQGIEAMLADRARAAGVDICRECELIGFTEDADAIDVQWMGPAGVRQIRCAYLLGCDGGRSLVRKLAGFHFPGTPPTMTMYQAVLELDDPERRLPLGWNRTPGGVFAYGPFPGRLFMLDFSGPPADRNAPVTREEVEAALVRISGMDVRVTAVKEANRWTDNTRLVDTYRKGRVLLAGDAAHVHSPFGGQGLSLGLVDAANLGWKLAAVIRGDMPSDLLDTYTAERRPVAEAVLANTLAQVALMRPDPQTGAMREVMARLMRLDDVNQLIGEMMSGLSTRYDLGSEVDKVGRLIGDMPFRTEHPQSSLYDLMQDGRWVLLDASSGGHASRLVAEMAPDIRCVTLEAGPSLLIRPDACVAWTCEDGGTDGLEGALRRWLMPHMDQAGAEPALHA